MQLTDGEKAFLKAVYNSFPGDRLRPYLTASNHNPYGALKLYEWNTHVSAALYETLGHFEILYRNRIDEALSSRHTFKRRSGDWLDDNHGEFSARASETIRDAKDRALGTHQNAESKRGLIIAELNFGFWRRLIDERYDNTHGSAVMRQFVGLRGTNNNDMSNLRQLVEPLFSLRNRVAHHEPVWTLNLAARRDDAVVVLGLIDTHAREWVRDRCRLDALLQARP